MSFAKVKLAILKIHAFVRGNVFSTKISMNTVYFPGKLLLTLAILASRMTFYVEISFQIAMCVFCYHTQWCFKQGNSK